MTIDWMNIFMRMMKTGVYQQEKKIIIIRKDDPEYGSWEGLLESAG